jgi:hypothetical protein
LEFAGFENDQQPSGILPCQLLLVFVKENGLNQEISKNVSGKAKVALFFGNCKALVDLLLK